MVVKIYEAVNYSAMKKIMQYVNRTHVSIKRDH